MVTSGMLGASSGSGATPPRCACRRPSCPSWITSLRGVHIHRYNDVISDVTRHLILFRRLSPLLLQWDIARISRILLLNYYIHTFPYKMYTCCWLLSDSMQFWLFSLVPTPPPSLCTFLVPPSPHLSFISILVTMAIFGGLLTYVFLRQPVPPF